MVSLFYVSVCEIGVLFLWQLIKDLIKDPSFCSMRRLRRLAINFNFRNISFHPKPNSNLKMKKKNKQKRKKNSMRANKRIELFVCLTHRQVLVLLIAVMNVYLQWNYEVAKTLAPINKRLWMNLFYSSARLRFMQKPPFGF